VTNLIVVSLIPTLLVLDAARQLLDLLMRIISVNGSPMRVIHLRRSQCFCSEAREQNQKMKFLS
jgi:hypothetical protein